MSDAVGRLLQNVVNLERIANSVTAEAMASSRHPFRILKSSLLIDVSLS